MKKLILEKACFQLNKLVSACKYALSGLKYALSERAFFQELLLGIPVFFICYYNTARLYIFSAYLLVLITEMINTAIEKCVDRISVEYHPLSREIKDIASAAVFLAIIHLLVVIVAA